MSVRTLGFRDEALQSISSVARLASTRHAIEPHAWSLAVNAGHKSPIMPAAPSKGIRIQVDDLFVRRQCGWNFLKTDRAEAEAIHEVVRRLAKARPEFGFSIAGDERAPATLASALPGPAGH